MRISRFLIFIFTLVWGCVLQAQPIDRIVAIVNDQVITQSQLDQRLNLTKQEMTQNQVAIPPDKSLKKEVLDHMIDEALELQLAKRLGIQPTEVDVDEAIAHIAEQNQVSLEDLKSRVEQTGLSYDQYRERIRTQMILSQVVQKEVGPQVVVNDQAVEDLLPLVKKQAAGSATPAMIQTHARHIMIKVTPMSSNRLVQTQLQQIREQILQGASFEQLAKKYSQDIGSASRGGDLGWVEPGMLDPQFETIMNQLKPMEISQPFKTAYGWHIVQVLERKTLTSGELYWKNQARQAVYQQKFQEALQNWLSQLKNGAYIKRYI